MAQNFGASLAVQMGFAHEREVATPLGDMLMDLHNNAFGAMQGERNPGISRVDAIRLMQLAIKQGCLRTSSF
jgi:hypothetical protein